MRSHLRLYRLATGAAETILTHDGRIEAPNWAPDGTHLLVNGEGLLWRVPLDAPALVPVPTGPADRLNNDHGISPDGATVYLCSHHQGDGSRIYRLPAAGGAPEALPLPAKSWWHGISPDGTRIAYVGARAGGMSICTAGADGTDERVIFEGGHNDGPDYAPDGRIFWNSDVTGHAQVWVMGPGGQDPRQLWADDQVNWFPHPSPDGRHLVTLAYPPGTQGHPADLPVALVLSDLDGADRRRILTFTGGQGTINVPSWAPDGSAFAFMAYQP
jgi:Tol biopolymer transport system component